MKSIKSNRKENDNMQIIIDAQHDWEEQETGTNPCGLCGLRGTGPNYSDPLTCRECPSHENPANTDVLEEC
jgi:hypothetical protein